MRDLVRLCMDMDMDERHGRQHGRSAFVQYLVTDVAGLCRSRFASDQARAEALSVASTGTHLAGWKAYDSGEQGPGAAVLPSVPVAGEGIGYAWARTGS
ncbi:hypothetical protein [Streptomyces sp. NPDC055287]